MANGTAAAKYPNIHLAEKLDKPKPVEGFWARRWLDLGILTMQPPKPYWNTTMVTAWVAVIVGILTVLGAVGGLYIYTRDTNLESGIKIGEQRAMEKQRDAEIERLKNENERMIKLLLDAGFDINNPPKQGTKK